MDIGEPKRDISGAALFFGKRGWRGYGRRYPTVKTARFAKVVEQCGKPENYLVLMEPAKDSTLQKALKANRVMTVVQEVAGTKADHGEIGFEPGRARQFLVFPKSLRAFAGRAVVGIKYELLNSPEVRKSERSNPPRPGKTPKSRPAPAPATRRKPVTAKHVSRNVVAFQPDQDDDEDEGVAEIKKQIRHAMAVLEQGKAVAAFNLLKRIVED